MVTPTMNGSASTAVETCPAEIREILQAAACGTELTFEQGLLLATAQGSAVEALVAVADELRRETVGDAITYVVNRNINFTNVCFVGCSFCGFGRGPGAADAYSLSFEEVVPRARSLGTRRHGGLCSGGAAARPRRIFLPRSAARHQARHSRDARACILPDGNRLWRDENRNATARLPADAEGRRTGQHSRHRGRNPG